MTTLQLIILIHHPVIIIVRVLIILQTVAVLHRKILTFSIDTIALQLTSSSSPSSTPSPSSSGSSSLARPSPSWGIKVKQQIRFFFQSRDFRRCNIHIDVPWERSAKLNKVSRQDIIERNLHSLRLHRECHHHRHHHPLANKPFSVSESREKVVTGEMIIEGVTFDDSERY